ncbi:2-phytyl-1-4-beta-naphthoquinone methyltransferase- chloroplastic [Striga hermonthica]|uniref:2-phytyl-1-4-beta-naphthoquinone methyltransferase- chloroplastic n=1 Tax=Striga hermonthica TaxID=68872 RepID=A0A9N7R790_STRHE|nr:2-phytyl-1-4-beta-naphthoquinone methyltransferase- chloroplastic [Striga hermonthica]
MATLHFTLPSTTGRQRPPEFRSIFKPARCAAERQALFDRIAPVYDNLNDLLSLGGHRVWKRMAVSWTGAKEGDTVLDVCCGSGDLAFLLSEKVGVKGKIKVGNKEKGSTYPEPFSSSVLGLVPEACCSQQSVHSNLVLPLLLYARSHLSELPLNLLVS